ncbi:MAG: 50S ribosomal protein L10 [Dehalococcoidales bacterium]|nr:50S ribosomal protein L10 [Dehalococcoidales bacterium]
MSKEKKAQIIEELQEDFTKSNVVILTDYRGLATPQMTTLRRRLQESNSEYKVVKNTLARIALERDGGNDAATSFEGPTAIVMGYGDITAPARILIDYIRESQASLSIRGGFLKNRLITAEEVKTLATLPSREILLAKVLGQMQSPIVGLLGCLTSPIRGIMGVLQARINQLEGE